MTIANTCCHNCNSQTRIIAGDDSMIYTCAKCKFIFERKNESSKCPHCDSTRIVQASKREQQKFKELQDNSQSSTANDSNINSINRY